MSWQFRGSGHAASIHCNGISKISAVASTVRAHTLCHYSYIARQPKRILMALVDHSLCHAFEIPRVYILDGGTKSLAHAISLLFFSIMIFSYDYLGTNRERGLLGRCRTVSAWRASLGQVGTQQMAGVRTVPWSRGNRRANYKHSVSSNYFLIFKWIFPLVLKRKRVSNMR